MTTHKSLKYAKEYTINSIKLRAWLYENVKEHSQELHNQLLALREKGFKVAELTSICDSNRRAIFARTPYNQLSPSDQEQLECLNKRFNVLCDRHRELARENKFPGVLKRVGSVWDYPRYNITLKQHITEKVVNLQAVCTRHKIAWSAIYHYPMVDVISSDMPWDKLNYVETKVLIKILVVYSRKSIFLDSFREKRIDYERLQEIVRICYRPYSTPVAFINAYTKHLTGLSEKSLSLVNSLLTEEAYNRLPKMTIEERQEIGQVCNDVKRFNRIFLRTHNSELYLGEHYSIRSIKRLHDQRMIDAARLQNLENIELHKPIVYSEKLQYAVNVLAERSGENWHLPEKLQDLITRGAKHHICVGSYTESHMAEPKTECYDKEYYNKRFVLLCDNATMELRYQFNMDKTLYNMSIPQCNGPRNKSYPKPIGYMGHLKHLSFDDMLFSLKS